NVLCPGNSAREILPEFFHVEVRALTLDTQIAQDSSELGAFVFGDATEAGIGVTHRRAQLDRLKSGLGKLLERAGKVLGDHRSDGIRLASNWHAKRIGAKLQCARGQEPGHRGIGRRTFEKFPSRNYKHSGLLTR